MHLWWIVNTGTCHSPRCTCVFHSPVIIKAREESFGRTILDRLFMACNLFLRDAWTLFSLRKSSFSRVALSNCLVYAEMWLKIYIIYQKGNNVLFILSNCPLEVLNDKMHAVFGMKGLMSHLSHLLHLCIFFITSQMSWNQRKDRSLPRNGERKRPNILVSAGGELPLVVGPKQAVLSFPCVKSGLTPGCQWHPHLAQEGQNCRNSKGTPHFTNLNLFEQGFLLFLSYYCIICFLDECLNALQH